MSEQKSFMQALDLWSETKVIDPLLGNDGNPDEYVGEETIEQISPRADFESCLRFRYAESCGANRLAGI